MQEADRIQYRMKRIRREMDADLDEAILQAQRLMDWKYYVERYPWGSLAAAAVVGYLVIPRRPEAPQPAIPQQELQQLRRRGGVVIEREQPQGAGIMGALGGLAANLAMKTFFNLAGQQLHKTFGNGLGGKAPAPQPREEQVSP